MAAPNPVLVLPPSTGEQPLTYPQLLDKLKCTCTAGAQIRPSSLPSATVNIGDIIADHSRVLSALASAYGVVAVVMQMITCIMEVLCAINNPFALIDAMIRLFGTCLPDFILILPQLAIPAKIICIIKVVIAIVEYILTVILPLIQDLIQNITNLIDAVADGNLQAISAISFKITSLIKELYSVVGVLAVLSALFVMIKALLDAGIAIPCSGTGGSCSGCGEDQCPSTIQQSSIVGSDGILYVLYGSSSSEFQLRFYSESQKSSLLQIRDFFPKGINYSTITDEDDLAYTIEIDDIVYAVQGVNSEGAAAISVIPEPFLADGYLSDIVSGAPLISALDVRFGTNTETFLPSFVNTRYVEIIERNSSAFAATNNGTWLIKQVYDGYNVKLQRESGTWSFNSGAAPSVHMDWKVTPAIPSAGSGKSFQLDINHNELIRHGLIGVGCHPAIKAAAAGLANRFPFAANLTLPALPDFDKLLVDVTACLAAVAPITVDTEYVLNNLTSIATGAAGLSSCLTATLTTFEGELIDYAEDIYPVLFSPENSLLSADPLVQVVGEDIIVTLTPIDLSGQPLGQTLPPGVIEATIETDAGDISNTTEVFDDGGDSTGNFIATLTSNVPTIAKLSAVVGGEDVADFNGSDLIKREIEVEFVPRRPVVEGGGVTEPLGSVRAE